MKVVILAGGHGSRLAEETTIRPKPMVEIGSYPTLWHILKSFDFHGFKDFVITLGYKGHIIRDYFENYVRNNSHMAVDFATGEVIYEKSTELDWKVALVNTGLATQTGGRIKRIRDYVNGETFMCTYGDGVSNVNIRELVEFHKSHGKLATLTAVHPSARFGHLEFDGNRVIEFAEKPQTSEGWINGGFFVLEPEVFDYIDGDHVDWSKEPLERLCRDGQLMAFRHKDFWQCMDTMRDRVILENLWESGHAPWKLWMVPSA